MRRDKPDLYGSLRESFASAPVEVILDRRAAERGPVETERRRDVPSAQERDLWENLGFRLIYRGDDVTVYEDETRRSGTAAPA